MCVCICVCLRMKAVIIGLAALCVDIDLNAMIVIDRLTSSELTGGDNATYAVEDGGMCAAGKLSEV